jgi:hypothetical protein
MRDLRPRAATLVKALAALAAGAAGACSLSQEGVGPPPDRVYFPTSGMVDPSGKWLFVANSNSDLRYNDGTLVAIDLGAVQADRDPAASWGDCPEVGYIPPDSNPTHFCCRDLLDSGILDCDERSYIPTATTVKIGSFGSGMEKQNHCPSGATDCLDMRLYIGVRGDGSVTWIDIAAGDGSNPAQPVVFNCGMQNPGDPCNTRVLNEMVDPTTVVNLPDEPYALGIDKINNLLYVGHLRAGAISILDVSQPEPVLIAPFPNVFPPDGNGNAGVTSINFPDIPILDVNGNPIIASDEFFATSRYVPTVLGFAPTHPPDPSRQVALTSEELGVFTTGHAFATPLAGGAETRGVQLVQNADGTVRAFVLQRTPPTLISYDVGTQPGEAFSVATEITETCGSPTFLYKHASADGELLYVNCFDDNRVYVFEPLGPDLIGTIDVGQGPAGLVFAQNDPRFAYVIGFGGNNLSVLDLDQRRVVQRIGFPSKTPR